MIITEEEKESFKNEEFCHICNKKYDKEYKDKVKDHDHYTGKYKGSAHRECNRNLTYSNKLNVFFHNLRGYDSHFLIQEIGKFNQRISVIPHNTEKCLVLVI